MSCPPFILATSSKYRQAQFASLGIDANIIAPEIDENPLAGEQPAELAERLALAKAQKVASSKTDVVVIAGDQVAAVTDDNGIQHILGKPHQFETACQQLHLCSNRTVTFYSALAVISGEHQWVETDITQVHFRPLSNAQIVAYLRCEQPYDCAGSFKSEGKGVLLFDRIDSRDPNGLIGLPVMLLRDMMSRLDIDLLLLACGNND